MRNTSQDEDEFVKSIFILSTPILSAHCVTALCRFWEFSIEQNSLCSHATYIRLGEDELQII